MSDEVSCPICSQQFAIDAIERHVDKCLTGTVEKPVLRGRNKQISSPFFGKKSGKRRKDTHSPAGSKKIKTGDSNGESIVEEECVHVEKDCLQPHLDDFAPSKSESILPYNDKGTDAQKDAKKDINRESLFTLPSPPTKQLQLLSPNKDTIAYAALPSPPDINETGESIDLTKDLETIEDELKSKTESVVAEKKKCNEESLIDQLMHNSGNSGGTKETSKQNDDIPCLNLDSPEPCSSKGRTKSTKNFFQRKKLNFEKKNSSSGRNKQCDASLPFSNSLTKVKSKENSSTKHDASINSRSNTTDNSSLNIGTTEILKKNNSSERNKQLDASLPFSHSLTGIKSKDSFSNEPNISSNSRTNTTETSSLDIGTEILKKSSSTGRNKQLDTTLPFPLSVTEEKTKESFSSKLDTSSNSRTSTPEDSSLGIRTKEVISNRNSASEKVTDASKSPLTTFQQELFNMASSGADETYSPIVTSNKYEKSEKVKNKVDTINRPTVKKKEVVLGKLPLAEQVRPQSLDDFVGQDAVSAQKLLKELFYNNLIPSMVLWGPPGCGKTSLAHIVSQQCKSGQQYRFVSLSATMSGVNDVKEAVKVAKNEKRLTHKQTVLFIDEVHRFNKMQQDSFLPHIEDGTIVFIGATTENPSFHLNNALLSRCRLVVLKELTIESIEKILRNAVERLHGIEVHENNLVSGDHRFTLEDGVIKLLAEYSNGDARVALTSLDMILQSKVLSKKNSNSDSVPTVSCEQVYNELKRGHINYDRNGEDHYNMISAFHKSIRGGDEDATIYWLARMLEGGEEPLYIARRMIRIASEDIGLEDSAALNLAVSAYQACQFIGMPECDVILAHAAAYLSKAPKSIGVYEAYNKAKKLIKECSGPQPLVPLHLRNAPTKLMKDLGYSKGYKYTPRCQDDPHQDYLPSDIVGTTFFKI